MLFVKPGQHHDRHKRLKGGDHNGEELSCTQLSSHWTDPSLYKNKRTDGSDLQQSNVKVHQWLDVLLFLPHCR